MSDFDGISKAAFGTVEQIMSDVAIWIPSDNSGQQSEKVLFKNPEEKQTVGDVDKYEYSPFKYSFEYYEGQFPGLKLAVDSGNIEVVTINGVQLNVRDVTTKVDGKNYIAYCDLHESEV
jgi:hypothetical protein